MAVKINIDLDTSGATGKVERLRQQIRSLDGMGDDLDLGLGGDLEANISALEDFLDDLDQVKREMRQMDAELDGMFDDLEATVNVNEPDGSTGGDGEADPPGGDGGRSSGTVLGSPVTDGGDGSASPYRTARRIESRFDLADGTINADSLHGMEISEVNAEIAEFVQRRGMNPYPNKGLLKANRDTHDLLLDSDGTFRGTGGSSRSLLNSMGTGRSRMASQSAIHSRNLPDMEAIDAFRKDRADAEIDVLEERFDQFRNIGGGLLGKVMPQMRTFRNAMAALIPILPSLVTQLGGVAAAMGGVAVAGASVLALGLVGHGEDMEAAWSGAQEQIQQVGEDLFEVFQPAMQTFAPIQAEFFDWMPTRLDDLANSMEGLQAYGPTIFRMFNMAASGAEEFVGILNQNEDMMSQLAIRFGGLIGSEALDFFEWLIQTGYENQEMLIQFGAALADVGVIVYRVSTWFMGLITALRPLITILLHVTNAINGFGTELMASVGFMWVFIKVLGIMNAALAFLGKGGIVQAIYSFATAYTSSMASAITVTLGLVTAIGLLTAGLSLLAGFGSMALMPDVSEMPEDMPGGGGVSGAGYSAGAVGAGAGNGGASRQMVVNDNSQTTVNVQGEMDTFSRVKVQEEIKKSGEEKGYMKPPSTPSDSSDGDGS